MDLTTATLSSTYLASRSEARTDAVRKLRCKQGFKQQGAVCKPIKEGAGQPLPVASKENGLPVKGLAAISAIAVAGYLGTKLEQSNDFKAITGIIGVSPLLMNSDKIDEFINKSPLSEEVKKKALNLTGFTKLALMKRTVEGSGYTLESIDDKNNSFTYRNKETGDIKTIGSAGSALLTFSSTPVGKKGEPSNAFRMEFQVNIGHNRNTGRSAEDATSLMKIASSSFKEHLQLLPDNCIVGCMVADDDGQGKRRESIYKRAGFARVEGMDLGMDLYGMKVDGELKKIKTEEDKQALRDKKQAKNDSVYESARQKVREDMTKKLQCKQGFKQQGAVCKPIKQGMVANGSPSTSKNRLVNPLIAGASLLGLSTAAYVASVQRYRANFNESAKIAKEESKKIDVEDIPDNKEQITFSVGGFYGTHGEAASRKGEKYLDYKLGSEILSDTHHNISHENKEFNVGEAKNKESELEVGVSAYIEHYKQTLGSAIEKGYNPESRKLAAKILAYHAKYPDKPINSVGHSAGGMINRETAKILEIADPTSKDWFTAVNLGSAHFGILPETNNVKTIAIRSDAYLKTIGPPPSDTIWVGDKNKAPSPDDHQVRSYMNNPEVRKEIKKILDKPKKQPKEDSVRSIAYLTARELARHDAKVLVKVPAKNGRKAYSYYREGKEAVDEPDSSNRQTVRPTPTQPQVSSAVSAETEKAANEDLFALMNIRDLKQEARNRGIVRYSYMTRDQLQGAIKFHDANPDYKENLIKTVQRQKDLDTLKKVKSSEIGRAISTVNPTLGRQYNLLNAIAKKYEKNPTEALIYALPAILGVTKLAANALKKNRTENIKESAGAAVNDADKYKEDIDENTSPESVNFFVGGYGRGSKDLYNRVASSPYASSEDKDWIKNSENITINRGGEDLRSHNMAQKVFNDIATGYNITANNTFQRGKNKESVELAAQLYAHGSKYRTDQDGVKSLRPIQILAGEDGGIVARDALEILDQMPGGKAIAKRVKFVTLGTPYFGESKVDIPEVNLVGDGDPWAVLPFNKGVQTKRVSTVSGGSQQDYTASADAMGKVFENMRSGLSDRAVVDGDSAKAAKRAKEEAGNEVANREKAARDAVVNAERDRVKAEKDKQYEIRWKTILRQQAGNDTKKFEELEKDLNAVYKAQIQADKDIEKEKKEQKKLERARRGVKK